MKVLRFAWKPLLWAFAAREKRKSDLDGLIFYDRSFAIRGYPLGIRVNYGFSNTS